MNALVPTLKGPSMTEAMSELYRRAGQRAYGVALAITGDAAASEDLVQEVFLRVLRRPQRLETVAAVDGYVVRAVRNAAYDHLRRQKTARAFVAQYQAVSSEVAGEAREPVNAARINAALASLPPEQREVIHLRVYEGLQTPEVASLTGVPLGTVHSRYRYALQKLRGLLADEVPHA